MQGQPDAFPQPGPLQPAAPAQFLLHPGSGGDRGRRGAGVAAWPARCGAAKRASCRPSSTHHPELGAARWTRRRRRPGRARPDHRGGRRAGGRRPRCWSSASARAPRRGRWTSSSSTSASRGVRRHILVQELPRTPESFIHLDMVFTMLDRDLCLVYAPVVDADPPLRRGAHPRGGRAGGVHQRAGHPAGGPGEAGPGAGTGVLRRPRRPLAAGPGAVAQRGQHVRPGPGPGDRLRPQHQHPGRAGPGGLRRGAGRRTSSTARWTWTRRGAAW